MSFHQPDPSNAPELSVCQQFEIFTRKGGNTEDFVLQTAENIGKIFAIGAHPIEGGAVTFLGGMFRSDRDPQSTKIIIAKINKTQEILTGNIKSELIQETEQNLGIHYIGNH